MIKHFLTATLLFISQIAYAGGSIDNGTSIALEAQTSVANKVDKTGDTMTGDLVVNSSVTVNVLDVLAESAFAGPTTFLSSATFLQDFTTSGDISAADFSGSTMALTGNGASNASLAIAEGRVGFGTTAPAEALDVRGDAVFDSSVNASAFFGDGAGLTNVTGTDATRVLKAGDTMTGNLNINGNSLFRASDGALGIGLTSPGENFHQSGGSMLLDGTGATTRDAGWHRGLEIQPGAGEFSSLVFGNQGTGESSAIVWTESVSGNSPNQIGATIWATPQSATRTDLYFTTNDTIGTAVDDVQMVITGPGNIGMGTTSPATKLDVVGTTDSDEFTESGSTTLSNDISGNAATATNLAANGTNAGSGRLCLGIDASGNCEDAAVDALAVNGSTNPVQSDALFDHDADASAHHTKTTDASELASGTLPSARLDASSVTLQGNAFNTANKLVRLDGSAKLPAVDGSQLTNITENIHLFAIKSASETVNNSTTLQDDDHLKLTLAANTTYNVTLCIMIEAASSNIPDFKFTFSGPALSTASFAYHGSEAAGSFFGGSQMVYGEVDVVNVNTGTTASMTLFGVVITAGSGGDFTFRWAQNSVHASDVYIRRNGYLRADKVGG